MQAWKSPCLARRRLSPFMSPRNDTTMVSTHSSGLSSRGTHSAPSEFGRAHRLVSAPYPRLKPAASSEQRAGTLRIFKGLPCKVLTL